MNVNYTTITLVCLFILLIISASTKYYTEVCIFLALFTASKIIYQVYKYNERKHQISELSFKLKRENVTWPIFNLALLIPIIYNNQIEPIITNDYTKVNNILNIVISISLVFQTFIGIFQKPILSTTGFLCSDGRFINFSDLNEIIIKDNSILHYKNIDITYKTDKSYIFSVSYSDYSKVKNHLQTFTSVNITEKF